MVKSRCTSMAVRSYTEGSKSENLKGPIRMVSCPVRLTKNYASKDLQHGTQHQRDPKNRRQTFAEG